MDTGVFPPTRTLLPTAASRWLPAATLVGGISVIVAARFAATTAGLDAIQVGAAFGVALGAVVVIWSGPWMHEARPARAVQLAGAGAFGVAIGLALVVIAILGPMLSGSVMVPGLGRPAASFLPWAAVTVLVAAAEEALLRGVLFDRVERAGGVLPAVIVTSVVFAVMHVPLYGWHVVPLDLAVGLVFAGLRVSTRTVVAPAAAHAVADLGTWWL